MGVIDRWDSFTDGHPWLETAEYWLTRMLKWALVTVVLLALLYLWIHAPGGAPDDCPNLASRTGC